MVGDRVCECMHARAIHDVLKQGRTVQKGGSKPPNPPANHTMLLLRGAPGIAWILSGVERRGRRGRAAPGDTISRGDTKRKKIINFLGKMVENIFWGG